MSYYRRANTPGTSYFFTVVTYRRQRILCDPPIRTALRNAINKTRIKHPFTIDAWVLLPDHLHCIWTLPDGDADFSLRWAKIKRDVSLACGGQYKEWRWLSESKRKHRESTIWQRRYWEHRIRDEEGYRRHMDYIHYNPVHHGLCDSPAQWPWSTLASYVAEGVYPTDWGSNEVIMPDGDFGE